MLYLAERFPKSMEETLNLTVPRNCHQPWNAMLASVNGRFCGSCQKEVIDFSNFSQSEIQEWFRVHKNGNTCGRFNPKQLSTPEPVLRNIWFSSMLKANAVSLFLIVLPMGLKATSLRNRDKIPMETVPIHHKSNGQLNTIEQQIPVDSTKVIKGIVIDQKEPIPEAVIKVKGTNIHAITDQRGQFTIDLSSIKNTKKLVLIAAFIGYEHMEKKVDLKSDKLIRFEMKAAVFVLGEVCVKRPSLFKRFIGFFKS